MKSRPDKIHERDLHYAPVNADPDFSPSHNKQVMAEVVKDYEANLRRKKKEHREKVKERVEAVAQYLKSLEMGGRSTSAEKYFGRRHLAYLRGQEIMERMKGRLVAPNGAIIRSSQ